MVNTQAGLLRMTPNCIAEVEAPGVLVNILYRRSLWSHKNNIEHYDKATV
jgi:hypothetical protein